MRRFVVAGGTGFIGREIVGALRARGDTVQVLSRKVATDGEIEWDGKSQGLWSKAVDGADGVLNFSGSPINVRWTEEAKRRIVASRVEPTLAFAEAIQRASKPPRVWLNASAVGFYGDTGENFATERTPAGTGFLAESVSAWEEALFESEAPASVRRVATRFSVVLGRNGGSLPLLSKLTRFFLGGAAGDGKQWMSWVHMSDVVGMVLWALQEVEGPVNITSPNPVRNDEFMKTLRRRLSRPWSPPTPSFVLRSLGPFLGVEPELSLSSARVRPEVARAGQYSFAFEDLDAALADLFPSRAEA